MKRGSTGWHPAEGADRCWQVRTPYPLRRRGRCIERARWTAQTTPHHSMLCLGSCGGSIRRQQASVSATGPGANFSSPSTRSARHALSPRRRQTLKASEQIHIRDGLGAVTANAPVTVELAPPQRERTNA